MSSDDLFSRLREVIEKHYDILGSMNKLVIFIDEFDLIKRCEDENNLIYGMLTELISYSKEKQKAQVILGTTDSFITDYLDKTFNINKAQYKIFELDWISHDETLRYLEYRKVPKELQEKIYSYFGGDFISINALLDRCSNADNLKIWDGVISLMVSQEIRTFNRTMTKKTSGMSSQEMKVLLNICKRFTDEDMLDYMDLVKEFSMEVIDKFLSRNIFYLKSGEPLSTLSIGVTKGAAMSDKVALNSPIDKFGVKEYLNIMSTAN